MAGGHRRKRAGTGASAKAKVVAIGAAGIAVMGAAGFGAYSLIGGEEPAGTGTLTASASPDPVKSGPPSAKEARQAADSFLTAWAAGKTRAAAKLTDDPTTALEALTSYREKAYVSEVKLTPGRPKGTTVPFTVDAQVSFKKVTKPWTYSSELEVVRDTGSGDVDVAWKPSVLHPKLAEGERLRTGEAEAPPIKAVDRNGVPIDPKAHPSLAPVIDGMRERYGAKAGGTAGVEVWTESAEPAEAHDEGEDGKAPAPETLLTLSKGTPGTLKTTLDMAVQKTAEEAVATEERASLVAVRPSTGEVLAVANQPGDGFNTALQGSSAPGSTMKVVTASMLIDKGLAAPGEPHPCPRYHEYGGWKFENVGKKSFTIEGGTFTQSFTASCNTAFISMAEKLEDDDLTEHSRDVFGIGLNWQSGVTTFDGAVPVQSDAQMAASLIGQGAVRMNPLTMASVSATVKEGVFKQPYLVSPDFDGRQLATAPRSMKPATAQAMRDLMRATAQYGTAAEAMQGLSGDIGAKTGSAEVDGQQDTNAWFTGYRGDLAAAAVVPDSGHGGEFAGPLVKQVLAAHGG